MQPEKAVLLNSSVQAIKLELTALAAGLNAWVGLTWHSVRGR